MSFHTYNIPVITLDGPSGSGKGTIGQLLAQELKWHFLDSGALYRALAHLVLQQNIPLDEETTIAKIAENLVVEFKPDQQVFVNDVDVTKEIRSELCGMTASKIAAFPQVREALLGRQRQFQQLPGLVADGRDMGSVVFPAAPLKIFLIADAMERARRRHHQLKGRGINVSLNELCVEISERDQRDEQRPIAPLKPAPDAVIVDTTGLSIQEALQKVREQVQNKLGKALGI